MLTAGFLTMGLAFAGLFLFGYDGAPACIPFLAWVTVCGAVLLFKEGATHDPQQGIR